MTKKYDLVIGSYNRELGIQDKNRNGTELEGARFRGVNFKYGNYSHFIVAKSPSPERIVYGVVSYNKGKRTARLLRIIGENDIDNVMEAFNLVWAGRGDR